MSIDNIQNIDLAQIKYLHEQSLAEGKQSFTKGKKDISWCTIAISCAAQGRLDCLKYLHEQNLAEGKKNCPWDERAFKSAIKGDHLDCLKYLHEQSLIEAKQSLPESEQSLAEGENWRFWDEYLCVWAAKGHLECLKYLHENDCPWDINICMYGAVRGHLDCLKYLHEQSLAESEQSASEDKQRSTEGKQSSTNSVPWDESIFETAIRGYDGYYSEKSFWGGKDQKYINKCHLECVKYLYKNGCPCNYRCMEYVKNVPELLACFEK
ncbi:MAG: ankyrin repeat domain-containing protein [Candidatus Aenigmarchaeota archaeon]|nr:ankyrin repeat domain-containing protein [Candidatus Aenigmarchaeota archaeon]